MSPPRLIAVVGPTAAGKTALAAGLARRLGGEIVSVDSRQVFRRLDVGTAKPDRALRAEIPHHLIDVADPDEDYDAARYAAEARAAIDAIAARGRPVVLCGGSGLYLRALTEGLCAAPPAAPEVRTQMREEAATRGLAALHDELAQVDRAAAARIAPRDLPRIVRALAVVRATGRTLSDWQAEHRFADRPYEVRTWVLSPPVDELDRRIAARARAMLEEGILEETAAVLADGYDGELPPLQAIGYREAQLVLAGRLDRAAAVDAIALATRRYAKRQRTWFRGQSDARWLDGSEDAARLADEARRHLEGELGAAHVS